MKQESLTRGTPLNLSKTIRRITRSESAEFLRLKRKMRRGLSRRPTPSESLSQFKKYMEEPSISTKYNKSLIEENKQKPGKLSRGKNGEILLFNRPSRVVNESNLKLNSYVQASKMMNKNKYSLKYLFGMSKEEREMENAKKLEDTKSNLKGINDQINKIIFNSKSFMCSHLMPTTSESILRSKLSKSNTLAGSQNKIRGISNIEKSTIIDEGSHAFYRSTTSNLKTDVLDTIPLLKTRFPSYDKKSILIKREKNYTHFPTTRNNIPRFNSSFTFSQNGSMGDTNLSFQLEKASSRNNFTRNASKENIIFVSNELKLKHSFNRMQNIMKNENNMGILEQKLPMAKKSVQAHPYINMKNKPLMVHIRRLNKEDVVYLSHFGLKFKSNDERMEELYRFICGERKGPIQHILLTKQLFIQHLMRRFNPFSAQKICKHFNIQNEKEEIDFEEYFSRMETFINLSYQEQMKLVFDIYDADSDGIISERDIITAIKNEDEAIFVDIIVPDLNHILITLHAKTHKIEKEKDQPNDTSCAPLTERFFRVQKDGLDFNEFMKVQFEDKIPLILDEILKKVCGFTYIKPEMKDKKEIAEIQYKDSIIMTMKSPLTGDQNEKVFEAFKKLVINPNRKPNNQFITQGSLLRNFNKLFGYKNEYLSSQLFKVISNGKLGISIHYEVFLSIVTVFFTGNQIDQSKIIFQIFDWDWDGIISKRDLMKFLNSVPINSPIAQEIETIIEFQEQLAEQGKKIGKTKQQCFITFPLFSQVLFSSILIQECQNAFLCNPNQCTIMKQIKTNQRFY